MKRNVSIFEEQTGITVISDDFAVSSAEEVNVVASLTSGTPATGAKVQITIDDMAKINTGTATWINSPIGNRTPTCVYARGTTCLKAF